MENAINSNNRNNSHRAFIQDVVCVFISAKAHYKITTGTHTHTNTHKPQNVTNERKREKWSMGKIVKQYHTIMPDSLGLYSKNASIYNEIALHCLFCSQRFCAKDKMWSSRSERRCPVPFATDRQLDTRLFLCVCVCVTAFSFCSLEKISHCIFYAFYQLDWKQISFPIG